MDWYSQMLEAFSNYWTDKLERPVDVIDICEFGHGGGYVSVQIETTFYFDDKSWTAFKGSLHEFIEELNE